MAAGHGIYFRAGTVTDHDAMPVGCQAFMQRDALAGKNGKEASHHAWVRRQVHNAKTCCDQDQVEGFEEKRKGEEKPQGRI